MILADILKNLSDDTKTKRQIINKFLKQDRSIGKINITHPLARQWRQTANLCRKAKRTRKESDLDLAIESIRNLLENFQADQDENTPMN